MMKGVKAFATSNGVDRLIRPLRSRFLEFVLPEYTWENFLEITQKLLHNRYGLDETAPPTARNVNPLTWLKRPIRKWMKIRQRQHVT